MSRRLSILVPMYNESEVIPAFFDTISRVLAGIDMDHEIICVNDGSVDGTLELLISRAAEEPRIKIVSFSRNFGKEAAMTAALDYASGDAAIPIDADLQDPPELIHEMVRRWNEGFDVVYAMRSSRTSDSLVKRKTAHWFYNLFNRLSEVDIPENVGDYRLMSRRVIDVIKKLPEKERFMKGLFCWPGFKSTTIEFERQVRAGGKTKFNYWKLWNFALSGITSFSTIPIRIGTYLGLLIATLAFFYGCYIIIKTLIYGIDETGYASIMVVVLYLGGVQ
jgi:glycosyltransferase involved in cell wall biosynthesis